MVANLSLCRLDSLTCVHQQTLGILPADALPGLVLQLPSVLACFRHFLGSVWSPANETCAQLTLGLNVWEYYPD